MAEDMRKLDKGTIEDIVKDKGARITVDEIIDHFGEVCDSLREADPEVNRAEIIVEACRRFYLQGYHDGLTVFNAWLDGDDSDGREITMEDLGL